MAPIQPDRLEFERQLSSRGMRAIAGVDEAGRGPLAGPLLVAAVVFPVEWLGAEFPDGLADLNDSKQLSPAAREHYHDWLTSHPSVSWTVVEISPGRIDRLNILRATHAGMREALSALPHPPDHALVDGCAVPGLPCPNTPLVRGDSRSYSIAAASVLAKVTRDRIMVAAEQDWPGYGFARHKGYPTREHLDAVRRLGPCPLHRRSFAPLRQPELGLG